MDADEKLVSQRLRAHIRTARNLAVLTPFQKSTRDRIAASIPPLAHRIRQDRLQIVKLQVYILILRQDHDLEQREWARLRHVALQAAAKSLRDGVGGVIEDVPVKEDSNIPTLSLSSTEDEEEEPLGFATSAGELPIIIRRSSDDQVHRPAASRRASASSYASVTPSSRPTLRQTSSDMLSATDATYERGIESRDLSLFDESSNGRQSTPVTFESSGVNDKSKRSLSIPRRRTSISKGLGVRSEDQNISGDEAEDWQNTRAARRVSLANLPHGHMRELSKRFRERGEDADGEGSTAATTFEEDASSAKADGEVVA